MMDGNCTAFYKRFKRMENWSKNTTSMQKFNSSHGCCDPQESSFGFNDFGEGSVTFCNSATFGEHLFYYFQCKQKTQLRVHRIPLRIVIEIVIGSISRSLGYRKSVIINLNPHDEPMTRQTENLHAQLVRVSGILSQLTFGISLLRTLPLTILRQKKPRSDIIKRKR